MKKLNYFKLLRSAFNMNDWIDGVKSTKRILNR